MTPETYDSEVSGEFDLASADLKNRMRVTRVLDLILGAVALLPLGPLMLLVAMAIRVLNGPPVLFRQTRTGWSGTEISVPKFRTMRAEPPVVPSRVDDASRVTTLGRILRRTGLDESPQLFNVLAGTMSLVGPRPLLPRYLPWYSDRERRRFLVRPGLTGLAQVTQRTGLDWDTKLALDAEFVDRYSVGLYLSVLVRTPLALLRSGRPPLNELPLDVERGHAR